MHFPGCLDSIKVPISIITTSLNFRSGYAAMLEKGLDFPFYGTKFENIGFDYYQHPGPLYFILDKELICKYSYEPLIHSSELTAHYLSKVIELFY